MPRFRVHLEQWVQEVATVVVEADDEKGAAEKALDLAEQGDLGNWSDGNASKDLGVTKARKVG